MEISNDPQIHKYDLFVYIVLITFIWNKLCSHIYSFLNFFSLFYWICFLLSGKDTWDERPYTKESTDWDNDNSPNRYRDRTYDEEYDLDKEDSESDSKYNYSNKRNELSPSPVFVDKKVNISLNPNVTNSPKKTNKPIKKVDLGAAANFGKDTNSQSITGISTATITTPCKY